MLNITAITHEHVHVYTVYVSLVPSPSSAAVFWLHFCILQDIKDIYILWTSMSMRPLVSGKTCLRDSKTNCVSV